MRVRTQRLARTVVVGVIVLGLTACTARSAPKPSPSVIATPIIVWKDGVEPSSPLEANRYVKFLRANLLGEAVAWNSGDFTIKQFISTTSTKRIERVLSDYKHQYARQTKYLGPYPVQPIRVDEAADGKSATIFFCEAPFSESTIQTMGFPPDWLPTSARSMKVWEGKSGRLIAANGSSHTDEPCDGSTVPVGLFDPRPNLPEDALKDPITKPKRAPLQWQVDELKRTVG